MKKFLVWGMAMLLSGCAGVLNGPDCRVSEDDYVAKIAEAQQLAIVYFADGKADLNRQSMEIIKQAAEQAVMQDAVMVVYGHASHRTKTKDPIQRILVNLDISNERAVKVVNALKKFGVPESRVNAIAMFDSRPVKKEITRADEAANRRAEIYLYRLK